jgi:hypothetical protein
MKPTLQNHTWVILLACCLLWGGIGRADTLELPRISVDEFEKHLLKPDTPVPAAAAGRQAPDPASVSRESKAYRVALRRQPGELALQDIKQMVLRHNFYDKFENPGGRFENDLIDNQDGTVTDRVTGLMWMRSVMRCCSYADVEQYMSSLRVMNHGRGFRGHADWRVPTTAELASLLEYNRLNKAPYNGGLFDAKKGSFFSADRIRDLNMPWIVFFEGGYIGTGGTGSCYYVRPVRSE